MTDFDDDDPTLTSWAAHYELAASMILDDQSVDAIARRLARIILGHSDDDAVKCEAEDGPTAFEPVQRWWEREIARCKEKQRIDDFNKEVAKITAWLETRMNDDSLLDFYGKDLSERDGVFLRPVLKPHHEAVYLQLKQRKLVEEHS